MLFKVEVEYVHFGPLGLGDGFVGAGGVVLHDAAREGGVDKGAELVPGGLHIMLIGLQKQLTMGDTVPLKLFFKDAQGEQQTVETTAEVRPMMMPTDKGKMTEKHLHHHHAH